MSNSGNILSSVSQYNGLFLESDSYLGRMTKTLANWYLVFADVQHCHLRAETATSSNKGVGIT